MTKKKKGNTKYSQHWGVRLQDRMDPDSSRWVFGPADYETSSKALEQIKAEESSEIVSYRLMIMEDMKESSAPIWGLWLADRAVSKNSRWVFGPADMKTVEYEKSKLDKGNYSSTVTYEIMEFRG